VIVGICYAVFIVALVGVTVVLARTFPRRTNDRENS
jgi:hypothetical protein